MSGKKSEKQTENTAENTATCENEKDDSKTLTELKELLEAYAKIPEDRRAAILKRAKREAAGEILTDDAIEEEKKNLRRFFSGVKDLRKKRLLWRKVEEIAFQAVTIKEAKESIITEGLKSEVVNGKQRYQKENPAVAVYDKYCRAYQSNIDKLIEYLPPKEEKAKSALAALRDGM